MGQDEDVDPSIPGRKAFVERDEEAARIRPAIDDHPAAARALDEDGVALADVEDGEASHAPSAAYRDGAGDSEPR